MPKSSNFQFRALLDNSKDIIGPICESQAKAARGMKRLIKPNDKVLLIDFLKDGTVMQTHNALQEVAFNWQKYLATFDIKTK
jgi:hypothetical protein